VFYDVRLVGFDSRSMSNGGGVDLALSFKNRPPCSDGGSTGSNEDGKEDDSGGEELTFGNLVCLSPGGRFRKVGIYSSEPPLLVQRCNGTTAGLGYLKVNVICPCISPHWAMD
jgi:hypothetical protein